jgi:hypothetical protein
MPARSIPATCGCARGSTARSRRTTRRRGSCFRWPSWLPTCRSTSHSNRVM